MSSVNDSGELNGSAGRRLRRKRSLLPGDRFRPKVPIRVWLTTLFVLVTALAAITTYEIVHPILISTLNQASEASFRQVGEQYEAEIERNPNMTVQRLRGFAVTRGLQWGIVRAEGGIKLAGDDDLEWMPGVVEEAVRTGEPAFTIDTEETGERRGQRQATYAAPIDAEALYGEEGTVVVFNRYFTESDIENVDKAVDRIETIALMGGALALLVSGFLGYVVADLISRRVSRLGVAAERLAAGNFDERITTRVEDEVGALGTTFNSMAASLKDAFEQIEQEKERGSAILDGMTDAVVGVDRDLNATFLNPRARELLDASDRDFRNRLEEILAKTFYAGPMNEPEVEAGDLIIEVRTAPLEEGALAILRDVTEERRVQQAKAAFIANASHELKTPIAALSGYLEMLEDEEDEEYRNKFLNEMRAQTDRLKGLAQILLDLSRLDANAFTFRMEEADLEELLYEVRRDFAYTGRPISIDVEEGVPPVETDPTQFLRVLTILLDNALKYSPDGSPIELGLSRRGTKAVISVTDRGCGIPVPEQRRIFERFYRVQNSTRADGTGLGLALADEVSRHLGGEIEVRSEPQAGSTFSVILPLSTRTPHAPIPQNALQNGQNGPVDASTTRPPASRTANYS
jgi:signal transduction histidine kinase